MGAGERLGRWLRWQRVPVAEMRIDRPRAEAWLAIGYAVFYIAASAITGLLISRWPIPLLGAAYFTQDFWYAVVFKIGLLLVVPLVIFHRMGYRLADLLPRWRLTPRAGLSILLWYLLGLIVNTKHFEAIVQGWDNSSPTQAAARLAAGFVMPLLMAGFPEEFVYRGILQTRLEAVWGRLTAISITSALFMAWHIPSRYFMASGVEGTAGNFVSVLIGTGAPVFVAGLILCLFWDRYRSFWPLVAGHWGVDTLPSLSSFFGFNI